MAHPFKPPTPKSSFQYSANTPSWENILLLLLTRVYKYLLGKTQENCGENIPCLPAVAPCASNRTGWGISIPARPDLRKKKGQDKEDQCFFFKTRYFLDVFGMFLLKLDSYFYYVGFWVSFLKLLCSSWCFLWKLYTHSFSCFFETIYFLRFCLKLVWFTKDIWKGPFVFSCKTQGHHENNMV